MTRNRAIRLIFETQIFGGRLSKHEPNVFGLLVLIGLNYLIWGVIVPQMIAQLSA